MIPLEINANKPRPSKPVKLGEPPKLLIKSFKNIKQLKNMYDFTSKKNKIKKFHVLESVILGTKKSKPFCIGKNPPWKKLDTQRDLHYLVSISREPEKDFEFAVDVPGSFVEFDQPRQSNWLVVGTLRSKLGQQLGYELSVGDVLKMGRELYRIAEVRQWFDENKNKIMEHSTYLKSVLGGSSANAKTSPIKSIRPRSRSKFASSARRTRCSTLARKA